MRCIAVMNQKGGVGKTTTAVNLAHALARRDYTVLAVDLDPQGHLGICLGFAAHAGHGVDVVLADGASLHAQVQPVREHLGLLRAGRYLAHIVQFTQGRAKRARQLRQALHSEAADQDFIILDCPPSSGIMMAAALYAADELLIPVTGDYLGLEGLAYLMRTVRHFEARLGYDLQRWLARTRLQPRRRLTGEVTARLRQHFPGQVLATAVRECEALAQSPSFGQSVFEFRGRSHGAKDYHKLADDLLVGRTLA